jgi:glycosidase
MRNLLLSAFLICGCNEGVVTPFVPDGGPSIERDAEVVPMWRDGCGDGGLGVSGGGVSGGGDCDGSTPMVDAGPPPPPCNEITFRYVNTGATSVWVSGTFAPRSDAPTEWARNPSEGALVMEDEGGGVWSVTALIEPHGRHEYKFIIDGTDWIPDPNADELVPDCCGGQNAVMYVCSTGCGDLEEIEWRDAIMYFAMVDRFFDSDGDNDPVAGASDGDARTGPSGQYEGGDLRGATMQLEYLADLGVSAVWLSAPYENRNTAGAAIDPSMDSHMYSGYHGYWPSPENISYADPENPTPRPRVESRIGTEADLHAFVDTAHATTAVDGAPMRVLFDYVMKHVDEDSGLYRAHNDWFAERRLCGPENLWDDPYWGTRCAFTPYLPSFDFENAAARAWSVNDALWWAREFDLDGYRLDAIKHVPLSWVTDLRSALTREFPDPAGGRFYLVGETFAYDDPGLLRRFVDPDTMLDGQFDFPMKARLCEAVFTPGGGLNHLSSWMDTNDGFYGPDAIMTTWAGNHDIPRVIHFASRQITDCRQGSNPGNGWNGAAWTQPSDPAPYERLAVAYAILMTNPGIPLLYYGDEVGLAGGGDPDNRRMMPRDTDLSPAQVTLRDRIRALSRLRGENRALTRGRRNTVSVDQDTWVYTMGGCGSAAPDVTVAINRADGARNVNIPAGSYTNLLTDAAVSGGSVSVPARDYLILGRR